MPRPLLVRYDLAKTKETWTRDSLLHAPKTMWRYAPVLPAEVASIASLADGMTPLLHAKRLGERYGAQDLWVKDEGINPTGSFKVHGLSCAISTCVELGIRKVAIPSAGNAASAMAAYAAAAGLESHIFMPRGASFPTQDQLRDAIQAFIRKHNAHAKPFRWRKREVKGSQLRNTIANLCP